MGLSSRAREDLTAPLIEQLSEIKDKAPVSYKMIHPALTDAIAQIKGDAD